MTVWAKTWLNGYNPLPDEKGTERYLGVEDEDEIEEVTILYPMKRGLKVTFSAISPNLHSCYNPLPDEKGTERTQTSHRSANGKMLQSFTQ